MSLEGQPRIFGRHSHSIVAHADPGGTPVTNLDADPLGSGVQRILDELLHDRGRPLHHLAGGDLVDELIGELSNATHVHRVA